MILKIRFFLSVLALCASAGVAAEETPIGYVKTATGESFVVTAGTSARAEPGTALYGASVLKTGRSGSMGVTLKDNTRLSVGPDTELSLDEFLYAPTQNKLGLAATMKRGTLDYVSGVIAKLRPEAVSIHTPSGNIGVRGTHFVLKVSGD